MQFQPGGFFTVIRSIKILIWVYFALLIFEGALRKWVMPGLAEPLLIVRDPVVILIYALALAAGVFPRNVFMVVLGALVALAVVFSMLAGQSNFIVTAYGIRTNFLHVPLIWVMAAVLDRRDAERLGLAVLAVAIPMTLLMVEQFRSPIDAWINRGVGSDEGGQIYGAAGHIRPPGFFSFITGPMSFFPLAAAFFLQFVTRPPGGRWRWLFVLASGVAIFIALPVSISRGTMINTAAVGAVFVACLFATGVRAGGVVRFAGAAAVLALVLSLLPVFHEARTAFMDRWDTAASQVDDDPWGYLGMRIASGFTDPIMSAGSAPFFGYGIGVGSNVGARLIGGRMGFALGENEWTRSIQEMGPMRGIAFIALRCAIALRLFALSWRALRQRRDALPMLIWTAASPLIVLQQWAPPTLLGFAVFGGGLVMASLNYPPVFAPPVRDAGTGNNGGEPPQREPGELEIARRKMRGLA
jgi:hypothetical protein